MHRGTQSAVLEDSPGYVIQWSNRRRAACMPRAGCSFQEERGDAAVHRPEPRPPPSHVPAGMCTARAGETAPRRGRAGEHRPGCPGRAAGLHAHTARSADARPIPPPRAPFVRPTCCTARPRMLPPARAQSPASRLPVRRAEAPSSRPLPSRRPSRCVCVIAPRRCRSPGEDGGSRSEWALGGLRGRGSRRGRGSVGGGLGPASPPAAAGERVRVAAAARGECRGARASPGALGPALARAHVPSAAAWDGGRGPGECGRCALGRAGRAGGGVVGRGELGLPPDPVWVWTPFIARKPRAGGGASFSAARLLVVTQEWVRVQAPPLPGWTVPPPLPHLACPLWGLFRLSGWT